MAYRTVLAGRYEVVDLPYLRRRANDKSDQRHVFYDAMLKHDSYEAYEAATDGIKVTAPTFGEGNASISGRDEILYARRNNRIADLKK